MLKLNQCDSWLLDQDAYKSHYIVGERERSATNKP